ncbi:hypothetical protein [Phytohabitans rumicis]|uniref:hypothetical protein n=1 Tax=Phytohabitans rumicis TaxID=1076125 RepID=UPI001FEB5BF0|nr:hypothetical protein [Phytohabitans rumicis]
MRRHVFPGRNRRINPSFTPAEYAEVVAAAERAGFTPTGFCAQAALAAARGETSPTAPASLELEALSVLQSELFDARSAVNRVGGNLNQAVTALHRTGEVPVWLSTVVAMCARTVAVLDEVISRVHRRVR